jgi:hypothetical protein
MSITYTYEIVSVDEAARCMEVVYSAEGHQTMHIGARLPFEGESLEAVIDQYAPIPYWLEQTLPVVLPQVGARGVIEPSQPAPQTPAEDTAFAPIFPTPMSGRIETVVFEKDST